MSYAVGSGDNLKSNIAALISNTELEDSDYDGPWVTPGKKTDVMQQFAHFEPEVRALTSVSPSVPE